MHVSDCSDKTWSDNGHLLLPVSIASGVNLSQMILFFNSLKTITGELIKRSEKHYWISHTVYFSDFISCPSCRFWTRRQMCGLCEPGMSKLFHKGLSGCRLLFQPGSSPPGWGHLMNRSRSSGSWLVRLSALDWLEEKKPAANRPSVESNWHRWCGLSEAELTRCSVTVNCSQTISSVPELCRNTNRNVSNHWREASE